MNKKILISFCIPTFNRCSRVMECIETVCDLEHQSIEIVVSDNHSQDETQDTITKFSKNESRIHYHRNDKNLGFTQNFLGLFEKAEGEYIFYVSDEDTINQNFVIDTLIPFLESERPNIVFSSLERNGFLYSAKKNRFHQDASTAILGNVFSNNYISGLVIKRDELNQALIRDFCEKNRSFVYPQELMILNLISKGKLATFEEAAVFMGKKQDHVILHEEVLYNHPSERLKQVTLLMSFIKNLTIDDKLEKLLLKQLAIKSASIPFQKEASQYGASELNSFVAELQNIPELSAQFRSSFLFNRIRYFASGLKKTMIKIFKER